MDGLVMSVDAPDNQNHYLRPADAQIGCAHTVDLRGLLHSVQVQDQSSKSRIVGIRKCIDQCVHRISAHCVVIDSRSIDEFVVELSSEKGVRKLSEELLQQTGNAIDVMLERFRVSKIDLRCIWTMSVITMLMGAIHKPLSNKVFICWI
jgi:hypothetical protein